jgi:hypothetical protein
MASCTYTITIPEDWSIPDVELRSIKVEGSAAQNIIGHPTLDNLEVAVQAIKDALTSHSIQWDDVRIENTDSVRIIIETEENAIRMNLFDGESDVVQLFFIKTGCLCDYSAAIMYDSLSQSGRIEQMNIDGQLFDFGEGFSLTDESSIIQGVKDALHDGLGYEEDVEVEISYDDGTFTITIVGTSAHFITVDFDMDGDIIGADFLIGDCEVIAEEFDCMNLSCDDAELSIETLLRLCLFTTDYQFDESTIPGVRVVYYSEAGAFINCDNHSIQLHSLVKSIIRSDKKIRGVGASEDLDWQKISCDSLDSAEILFRKSIVQTTRGCAAIRLRAIDFSDRVSCDDGEIMQTRIRNAFSVAGSIVALNVSPVGIGAAEYLSCDSNICLMELVNLLLQLKNELGNIMVGVYGESAE